MNKRKRKKAIKKMMRGSFAVHYLEMARSHYAVFKNAAAGIIVGSTEP